MTDNEVFAAREMKMPARWTGRLAALALAPLAATMASAQPVACDGPDIREPTELRQVTADELVGTYRCAAEGLTTTVHLRADGLFELRFEAGTAPFSNAEREELENARRAGRWRIENGNLILFERPTRAPTIELTESVRDPSVWMQVEVREADGRPARGLFIGDGPDANPRSELDNGVLIIPKTYSWNPGIRRIVRQGDELRLSSFTTTRTGANVFRYVYHPSEVEPFEIQASVIDPAKGLIAIPFGIGAAVLRRTGREK